MYSRLRMYSACHPEPPDREPGDSTRQIGSKPTRTLIPDLHVPVNNLAQNCSQPLASSYGYQ
jgi:hypothetical protein